MTGFLGADPDDLIELGLVMARRGSDLQSLAENLALSIQSTTWVGPDAGALRDRFHSQLSPLLTDQATRLGSGSRDLFGHAAQQDVVSSIDGQVDSEKYAGLLGGESWSDVINATQDAWELLPFDDPLTLDELGGRYIDSPEGARFDPAEVDLSADAIRQQRMRQGGLGDCWFLAGLMATAQSDPQFLADNIILRDDGTWEVTLYENGEPVQVAVDPDQLARQGARVETMDAQEQQDGENYWYDDEIGYMSIYEQAAINHLGPDYESVIADTPSAGLELLTGSPSEGSSLLSGNGQPSIQQLGTALDEGRPITVMTDPLMPFRGDLSNAHVYQVSGVDPSTNEIILQNPWGDGAGKPGEVRVPMDFFYENNIVMTGVGARPEDFGGQS